MRLLKTWLAPERTSEIAPSYSTCSWKPVVNLHQGPCHRFQHAVCTSENYVYLFGGRGPYGCLSDLWRFNIEQQTWTLIELFDTDVRPPLLEGHTMLHHENILYVFGGEVSLASIGEAPLWKFDLKLYQWTKLASSTGSYFPNGRREHVAVIYNKCMYIHGGYIDLKGPSKELWQYQIGKNAWKLDNSSHCPAARYKHSGVVHKNWLWICGGLMGMTDRNETQAWAWNFLDLFWTVIKIRGGPSQLFNHATCVVNNDVFIYGGCNKEGQASSNLWKANLTDLSKKRSVTWKVCQVPDKVIPSALSNHCLIALPNPKFSKCDLEIAPDILKSHICRKSEAIFKDIIETRSDTQLLKRTAPLKSSKHTIPVSVSCPTSAYSYADTNSKPSTDESQRDLFVAVAPMDEACDSISFESNESSQTCKRTEDANEMVQSLSNHGRPCSLLYDDHKQLLPTHNERVIGRKRYDYGGHVNTSYCESPKPVEGEMIKRFSYNLSGSTVAWHPIQKKNYQTTSFIENSSNGIINTYKSNTTVAFVNSASDAEVILPSTFYQNANALTQSEKNLHVEGATAKKGVLLQCDDNREYTMFLIGGSSRLVLHSKEPIQMWKCTMTSDS